MKKILITGATGFLGKYLVDVFKKNNYAVIATGRNKDRGAELVSEQVTFIACDLTNEYETLKLMKDVDIVVHAAALSSAWGRYESFYNSNVKSTENLVKACMNNNVKKIIFVSSPSVYTATKNQFNVKESDAPKTNKMNYYIETKLMAEQVIKQAQTKGINTVVIRPRGLFGVGDPSIVPRILDVNEKMGIPLFSEGQQMIDITYVENVAHSIFLAAENDNVSGETFNITNDEPLSFKEITDLLFKDLPINKKYKRINPKVFYFLAGLLEFVYKSLHIKSEPVLTKYKACTLLYSQTLNIEKAKKLLGYTPVVSVKEGIKIYTDWWIENDKKSISS